MKFERNKDIKEIARIGKAGTPYVVNKGYVRFKTNSNIYTTIHLAPYTIHQYLSQARSNIPLMYIRDNINEKGKTRDSELLLSSVDDSYMEIKPIENFKGEYVLFQDKLYGICVDPLSGKKKIDINMQW